MQTGTKLTVDPIPLEAGTRFSGTSSKAHPETSDFKPLIIIPAFNEGRFIGKVLDSIFSEVPGIPVLVVDDGSRDKTAQVAREHGAEVISLPFNSGYGVALQTGFRFAARNGFTLVIQMDADGQHHAGEIPRLIAEINKGDVDVVIGSRFLNSSQYRPSFARRTGIWIFGMLATLCTRKKVTDPTSGFQALKGDAIRFVGSDLFPPDFPDADFLILLYRCGFRTREVPVRMAPSPLGKSMHQGSKSMYYVFKMFLSIFVTLLRQRPESR